MADQELYASELASQFNADVHWFKLLLFWPRAFFILLISPWAPFKYFLNDPDRERRKRALIATVAELPDARSPSYLLVVGVVVTVLFVFGVAAAAFLFLPAAIAVATLAILGLTLAAALRLTARDRRPWRARSKFRDVFPF